MMQQPWRLMMRWSIYLISSVLLWPCASFAQQAVKPVGSTFAPLFPNAFSSADAIASQTATFIHGGSFGWNGTGWDRLQVDGSKNLKVLINAAIPTGSNTIGGVNLTQYTPVSGRLPVDGSGVTQPVSGTLTVQQATGTNLHIVCDSGCSSSAGFADNSAFTFGTTAVNPIAGVFDDTATNTATENSAAVARITAQKALHINIRNNSGTELGVSGAPLRVDPTGTTTQPVSAASLPLPTGAATLAEQQTQTTALQLIDNLPLSQSAATAGQSGVLVMGAVTTAAPTYTTGNTNPISLQTDGSQRVAVTNTPAVAQSGTWNIGTVSTLPALPANQSVNVAQINGVTPLMGNGVTGTGSQRVTIASDNTAFTVNAAQSGTWTVQPGNTANTTPWLMRPHDGTNAGTIKAASTAAGATDTALVVAVSPNNSVAVTQATAANLNARTDTSGATGAAPPARADFVGGLTSGATGGFVTGFAVCDSFVNVNVSTATTTLLVTGVSGRHVRICSMSLVTLAANNVALLSGTGATCGTGTTGMTGGTTAATGWNFAANGGITQGSGLGVINQTNATGDSVCIATSAATQLSGRIAYAVY